MTTARKCFRRTKEVFTPKYAKPWWSEKCEEVVTERHRLKNVFRRHPTAENMIAMRRVEAIVKLTIKQCKRKSWEEYCTEFNSFTPISVIYKRIGRLQNKFSRRNIPFLIQNQVVTDPALKVAALADNYEKVLNTPPHNTDGTYMLLPLTLASSNDQHRMYNTPFSLTELTTALTNLKNTSPGPDNVHNSMLSKLPMCYLEWLLKIYNVSFARNIIPNSWKDATIIPIHTCKPGKPISNVTHIGPYHCCLV